MSDIATHFYQALAQMLEISQQTVEQWVWGGVVLGFLFATVHLVTMLVTSWGDHHASSKSLLFSVLIHLFSGAGVIVLAPGIVREQFAESNEPIRIQEIELAGTQQTRTDEAGNTPIWETLPVNKNQKVTRQLKEVFQPEPSQSPEREMETLPPIVPEIPQVESPLVMTPDTPQTATVPVEPLDRQQASIPVLDSPEIPLLPTEQTGGQPDTSVVRSPRPRSITEAEMVARPQAGGVDRIAPEIVAQNRLRSPEIERGPTPELPSRGEMAEYVERRTAPEQATSTEAVTGELSMQGDQASQSATTENRNVTRSQRTMQGQDKPVTQPELTRKVEPTTGPLVDPALIAMAPVTPLSEQLPVMTDLPSINFDAVRRGETAEVPATYRLRDLARRKEIARQQGGTDASEEAVERSLAWLAAVQEPAGFWDGSKHGSGKIEIDEQGINRQKAGVDADTGLTGLTILAFLGAGYTQEEGKYAKTVDRAINWLISQQREDGYLGGNATRYAGMYCHGMAAYALAEAYGMRSERSLDDQLSQAVAKAVQFTVGMQNKEDGGWRYLPDWSGDMSMFGWQMMALKSAEIAGVSIPETARNGMLNFLVARSLGPDRGLAAYHPDYGPEVTPAMTAEALFCKQMMGIRRDNLASQEAARYLLDPENRPRKSLPNLYYWYYGTLSMYQYGGEEWNQWNEIVRELLVESQIKRGASAGSWNPDGPWGGYGGRIYSTTLATLSLEVYYRFLPLYRIGDNEQ